MRGLVERPSHTNEMVKIPLGVWGATSTQNLESRTDQQFWNRCPLFRDQAGNMTWDIFQSTMFACFGQPTASSPLPDPNLLCDVHKTLSGAPAQEYCY